MTSIELSGKGTATWNESVAALRSASSAGEASAALNALGAALANPSLDNASCRSEMLGAAAAARRNTWWTSALDDHSRTTAEKFTCASATELESGDRAADEMVSGDGAGARSGDTWSVRDLCGRICDAFRDPVCFIAVWCVVFFGALWRGKDINGHHVTRANIYRRLADLTHLLSFFVLLIKLLRQRSAAGVSIKTQEALLLVFLARYSDLFQHFVSLYNSIMKLTYIGLTGLSVGLIKFVEPWKGTYQPQNDTVPRLALVVVPAVLALCFHDRWSVLEIGWSFSIYLEAVAAIPQLLLTQRSGEVEKFMLSYLFLRGVYRALYIANWITRKQTEYMYHIHLNAFISAIVQTAPFVIFFLRIPKVKSFRRE